MNAKSAFWGLVWLGLSAFGCAHGAKPKTPDASLPKSAAPAPVSPSIFLWHVTSEEKQGHLWLLGSIHLQRTEEAQIDRAIFEAVRDCERSAFELDFDPIDLTRVASFIREQGMLPEGQNLRDVVSADVYAKRTKTLADLSIGGAQADAFGRMRPWMAAMMLQVAYAEAHGGLHAHTPVLRTSCHCSQANSGSMSA